MTFRTSHPALRTLALAALAACAPTLTTTPTTPSTGGGQVQGPPAVRPDATYLLPPAVILFGVVMLLRSLKVWTKPKEVTTGPGAKSSGKSSKPDDYIARFEEEVKKRN